MFRRSQTSTASSSLLLRASVLLCSPRCALQVPVSHRPSMSCPQACLCDRSGLI